MESSAIRQPTRRSDWHDYFLSIAKQVQERSTCPRKQVGVVITRDNVILATGYNGSITRQPHCDEVGCMMENDHCVRTIHAEVNAITNAAKMGTSVNGGTMYCTGFPCWPCFKVVANAGIKTVYVTDYYRINEVIWRPAYDLGIVFYIPVGSDPDGITIFKEVDSLDFKCRRKS